MRIPPLEFKILPESNPLKSRISVRRLAVLHCWMGRGDAAIIMTHSIGTKARERCTPLRTSAKPTFTGRSTNKFNNLHSKTSLENKHNLTTCLNTDKACDVLKRSFLK